MLALFSPAQMKSLPELRLKDFNGKPVARGDLKGEAFVVDFWATWCAPCIAEIPALNRLQDKYSSKGIKVLGVAMMSGGAEEIKPFVARHDVKYPVFIGDDNQAHELNIMGYPTTYRRPAQDPTIGSGHREVAQIGRQMRRPTSHGAGWAAPFCLLAAPRPRHVIVLIIFFDLLRERVAVNLQDLGGLRYPATSAIEHAEYEMLLEFFDRLLK
jgi:thiol-disulfide isomerase/thioredoxin